MPEDKLQKFVQHMREAGQPDIMIAESLIEAGNSVLEVNNLFGVSTIEELREHAGHETKEDAPVDEKDIKTVPLVDDDGNIVFGKSSMSNEPDPEPKPKPAVGTAVKSEKPEEKVVKPIADQEKEAASLDEQIDERVDQIFSTTSSALEEPAFKPVEDVEEKPEEKPEAEVKKAEPATESMAKPSRQVAPSATALHKLGSHPKESKKPNETSPVPEEHHEGHESHHSPHTYSETMEDLIDHKELEPADSESGINDHSGDEEKTEEPKKDEPLEEAKPKEEEKPEHVEENIGLEPAPAPKKEEAAPTDIPKTVVPSEPVIPLQATSAANEEIDTPPSLGDNHPGMPQEINVDDLKSDDPDPDKEDRENLQKLGDEQAKELDAEINDKPEQVDEKTAKAQAIEGSDVENLGQKTKDMQNSVGLKVVLILAVVGIVLAAAIVLMVRVRSSSPTIDLNENTSYLVK